MKNTIIILAIVAIATACTNHKPESVYNAEDLQTFTTNMLPYLYKRPDHVAYEDRDKPEHARHYQELHAVEKGEITLLKKEGDTLYFNFTYKDRSSLYEHYRAFGGKTVLTADLKPDYLHLLYHTPRLEPDKKVAIPAELFGYMVKHKNIDKYLGNVEYIKTPSADFYYNVEEKHWDMTPNSSWKFLEEMKEEAEAAMNK